jgi:transposase
MLLKLGMKIDGRTLDHKTLEHLRITAVRRVMEDGEAPSVVINSMGLCRTTIYKWLDKYEDEGWDALVEKIASGPEPKLNEKQRQRVKRWIVGKDPRQYGFEFGLWTRQIVADLIKEKMGISLCRTAVGKLLAQLEITPQKPLRRAYERDPVRVQAWVDEQYPALRRKARKHGASIFFLDEAGFDSEPRLGRTYGLKGETPVVPTTGQRQKVNVISAVNAQGAFWCQVYTDRLNGLLFVQFLREFVGSQPGKVYLVVDGHPAHKAKLVKDLIQELNGKLELHFLPPYAPDLNPDEFVWSYMKTNGLSKKPLRKNESLKERVHGDLAVIKGNRKLVRSFFGADSVAYASD